MAGPTDEQRAFIRALRYSLTAANDHDEQTALELLVERDRRINAAGQRALDVRRYDAGRERYVTDRVRALEGIVPLLMAMRHDESGDRWYVSRLRLEADRLPTPEEALAALWGTPSPPPAQPSREGREGDE